ncbi:nuclease [Halorubrum ezzemoulense]|uniref:Nuclease n=1 Tax=Halorubrum ezzemoulense TaxID=337243 RepID=A0A256JFF3_HALEZ|nr:lamin tail domain-containing protein [Halorubrum ezzemoulense]OYR67142.1 nuclease [Halorubrum ezzemoulense]OYR75487.1 nuclease [Halorubrum ezzemoulense]
MRRRTILLGLGAATGTGAALGTGAFSTASADRQVNISVADDANSFLALIPGEENGQFTDDSGDALVIDISGDDGVGVGVDTEYTFDDIVEVTNNSQDPTFVWTTIGSAAFNDDQLTLYTDNPETPLSDANAVELGAGESVSVGLYLDTTGIESDEYAPTLTIEAADDDPNGEDPDEEPAPPTETIPSVQLDSVSSLLDANQEPLTDESIIPIQAEPPAVNSDEDGNDDAVSYPDDVDIPVVAVDGSVVGVTGPFVATDTNFFEFGNEEFLLNLYDQLLGGTGTVLHDESHGQFYTVAPNDGDDFQAFGEYAETNSYVYEVTNNIEADLSGADAVVITSPSNGFTESELTTLSGFVDGGGIVFLHDQSDFNNFDATDNLNEIATELDVDFRFNDDQVLDDQNNTGAPFVPTTANFNTEAFPELFVDRDGLGVELDLSETYEVDVTDVADGDTVDIVFENGTVDTVRIVGIDTPETGDTTERLQEYEGIDDGPALKSEGDDATNYAVNELASETVTLSFDEGEGLRGNFGRLLGFLELSDGSVYNEQVIEAGEARVYDSGLSQHDAYWELEQDARANGEGIWEIADQAATDERRDDPVDELFFPEPVAVSGPEEPVASEDGEPLVAVDPDANVAAVGGPLIEESFEAGEGGPGIGAYGVFPFLTNVIDYVSDATGPVIVDGGHGQFAADFAVSAEDAAYYLRYLEGQAPGDEAFIDLEGVVDLASDPGPDLLAADGTPAARALILSTPTQALSSAEVTAVADFAAAGGAVILLGSAADTDALGNFDPVVSELGTDVELTDTAVTDAQNNLDGAETVPTTTNFDTAGFSELFTPFTADDPSAGGSLDLVTVNEDTEGDDLAEPQENVVFENSGDSALDLTGYTVSDATSKQYQFDGLTLQPGAQVTLYSGTGDDTETERYWGRTGSAIWNNSGDTVNVVDDTGTTVIDESYE